MVYTYSEAALKIAIAQLAQNVGWNGIGSNSFEILIDICARFVKELGKTSTCIANQFNRTQVNFDDLQLAFDYLGISLNELEDYYKHVEALPFAKGNLAKYPISTKGVKRINYPDLNEIRARAEFYEEWMPSIKLDSEKDNILNSKSSNDNDLNDENLLLNGNDLNEEEMDLRYLSSLKSLVGPEEKIGGFTELSALVPNYIYISELGQVLSYGGKEGKLPECKLPPLTAEDIERLQEEEEKKKQELQKEKEKVFQPLKLKINNKEKLKFKKYLKDPKLKKDYMSKELLKRAKKDKKLKPKMNLNKLSIKVSSLNSQNNNLSNKVKSPSPVENDSLSNKQDLIETAEKLGLSSEIDELKKLNKLKEKKMKEKKTKIMKEEDLEKQKRKRERMRKKQEELEKKQKLREERKLRREQKEKEKEEKRKAREKKKVERMKAKLEKSPRKPRTPKKDKGLNDSKDEIYDDTSNFSLNSSQTNSIKTNPNNSKDSNLNDYDEKEAAITLVSLSEDKKSGKKNKKQVSPNISLTSPIDSSEDDDFSFKMDDEDSISSGFSLNNSNLSNSNDNKNKNSTFKFENIQKPKLEEPKNKLEEPKTKFDETKNKLEEAKNKLEDMKTENKVQKPKVEKEKINKNDSSINLNSTKPIVTPVFKSLAERKAMPPEITDKPNTQKKEKLKKRIYDRVREDDLFKPMITLPTIKKKEKKPKKVFKELIETSESSSEDEKPKKDSSKKNKKEDSNQNENTLSKLTVKLPSRTSSPLPFISSKNSSQFSPKIKSKKDKSLKKEEKKDTFKENNNKEKDVKEKEREKDKDKEKIKKDKLENSSDKIKSKKEDLFKDIKKHDKINKSINEETKNTDSKLKKKAKIIITPTKAARKEAQENSCVLVTQTVSTGGTGEQIWICPSCSKPDDGSPMVGCDNCDDWYHWPCVGLNSAPAEKDSWFCKVCINKQQQIELKFKKKRKGDKDSENDQPSKISKAENSDNKIELQKNPDCIKKIKKDLVEKNINEKVTLDQETNLYICPSCNLPDDGSPMIGCDKCDKWFHWICVGIVVEPKDEETWYCSRCSKNNEVLGHKHKKHKKV